LLGTTNTGKTVLGTGAGGRIGSALVQALAFSNPRFLILLDHSEQNLHEINLQLAAPGKSSYAAILGDILDAPLMMEIFDRYRPQTIYHAAANMSLSWHLGIGKNGGGVRSGAPAHDFHRLGRQSAQHHGRVQARRRTGPARPSTAGTKRNAGRPGNVLGSHGSVGPLFQQQIQRGGPITVTTAKPADISRC